MTPKAWIVFGQTGEYSDHCEWWVRAYLDKALAQAECDRLTALVKEAGLDEKGIRQLGYESREVALTERIKPHDAQASADYTGLMYGVGEVELDSRVSA